MSASVAEQPWTRFELTIRVAGRTFVWTRFAPNAFVLVEDCRAALAREWPLDSPEILGYRRVA